MAPEQLGLAGCVNTQSSTNKKKKQKGMYTEKNQLIPQCYIRMWISDAYGWEVSVSLKIFQSKTWLTLPGGTDLAIESFQQNDGLIIYASQHKNG